MVGSALKSIACASFAEQWQHVAKTYEFVASLERFLLDRQNHTLPVEVEWLPKELPSDS